MKGENGVVIDSSTIAMIELVSGDNEHKLASGIDAAEQCSAISQINIQKSINNVKVAYESVEGVDECDTAVLIYECGKAKMPDLVTDLVIYSELKQGVKYKIMKYFY
jgi:hypothetical protein